jgi:tetratricopeptide (TPR) repeat protein
MAGPTHAVEWIAHPEPLLFTCAGALIFLAAVAFLFGARSSRRRIYLFCAIWIVLTIAPALNLNALWYMVDDRYLYAPSFGWSLAIAVAVMQIAAHGSTARRSVGAAMAVLLATYILATTQTERYWHDEVAFFQQCVEIAPYDSDHYYRLSLAAAMNKARDFEGARGVLERAVTLNPDDAHVHLKLAQQYQMMGREMDFEREFQKFNELSSAKVMRQRAAEGSDTPQPAGAQ